MSYQAKQKYGCKQSVKHIGDRSYFFAANPPAVPILTHRKECSTPWDQGQTSRCTGFASGKIIQLGRTLEGRTPLADDPSQDFLYANGRIAENTLAVDGGASIRDVAEGATVNGFCTNKDWDSANPANLLVKPSDAAYAAAKAEAGLTWSWIEGHHGAQLVGALKAAIANKDPIFFGVRVYESFESGAVAKTGVVPVPHYWEQQLGGHALAMIGWNDKLHGGCFEFANSWGASWGDHGYGFLPYAYVTNPRLASDFAAIQRVK